VDRVVPHHGLPGPVTLEGFILLDGLRLNRYRCCGHRLTLTTRRRPHAPIARAYSPSPPEQGARPHRRASSAVARFSPSPNAPGHLPSPCSHHPPRRRAQRWVQIESFHPYPELRSTKEGVGQVGWGSAKGGVGRGRSGEARQVGCGSARVGGCVCQYGCAMTEPIATNAANTALLTDRYELTMLQAALADGTASRRCVFEVFTRRLPPGRR